MSDTTTAPTPENLTAAEVCACIQRNFGIGGEQYAVLFEVRNGTAWRANRSVDAVVMSLWPSLGMELWGMEIKVSRSDWLRELSDPKKASDVFKHFDRWFLVAPWHVAKPEELPEPWGWFVPKDGKLIKVRDAAKNVDRAPIDNHFLAAIMRRISKTDDAFVRSAIEEALATQQRTFNNDVERRALRKLGELKGDAESWIKLRDLLKQSPDDYIFQPDVVEALRLVLKSGVSRPYSGLRTLIESIERFQGDLSKVSKELGIEKPKRRGAR